MRYSMVMTLRTTILPNEKPKDERRIIRVDGMPDQANIAALLRRAFAAGRQEQADDSFADLLDQIH